MHITINENNEEIKSNSPQRKAQVMPTPAQIAGALQYPNIFTAMKARYPNIHREIEIYETARIVAQITPLH